MTTQLITKDAVRIITKDVVRRARKKLGYRDGRQSIPPELWGKDHWSGFGYFECRCMDNSGTIEKQHMRCDADRHPAHAHRASTYSDKKYPTRLAAGVQLTEHDDWDVLDDIEAAGLVKLSGTGLYPVVKMTALGNTVAGLLRAHKTGGGNFSEFFWAGGVK